MSHPANTNLHISEDGLTLIKSFEGWYPTAYQDEVGVWTIGWGTTNMGPNGHVVWPGRTITEKEGEEFLFNDMRYFEDKVKELVDVPLTQHQFDALVSACYNLGEGNLAKSDFLKMLNRGNYDEVPGLLQHWDHAGGQQLAGLTRRRAAEGALFLDPKAPVLHEYGGGSGVQPTGITPQADWVKTLTTQSETARGLMVAMTGLMTTIGTLLDPITKNPWLLMPIGMAAVGVGYAFYQKAHDTRVGR